MTYEPYIIPLLALTNIFTLVMYKFRELEKEQERHNPLNWLDYCLGLLVENGRTKDRCVTAARILRRHKKKLEMMK